MEEHYGAQNSGEVKNILAKSLLLIGVCSAAMCGAGELIGERLSLLFVGYEKELLEMTVQAFSIFSVSFLFSGFAILGSSFFTALNDGLTSAAIIWTAASFGLAIGAGLYVQVGVALIISLSILIGLEKINTKFFPATRSKSLHLCFENETLDMNKISQTIKKHGMKIADVNTSRAISVKRIILHYCVQAPREDDFDELIADLNKIGTLSEFSITD